MGKYNHIVLDDEVGLTVHQILRKNFKFSAKFRTKMKYQSLVDLNGEITPGYIHPNQGDIISVRLPEEKSEFIPEDIHLDVLYEDDDLMLINKQTGLIVHPTKGHQTHTVANGLMKYMEDTGQSFKIRFANRIDMDTTGIIIVAKNANIQNNISDQMRDGVVIKKYLAIVHGIVEKDHFIIDKAIGRPSQESIRRDVMDEGGKEAISEVKVLSRFNDISLVEVILHTGRTHQIRVHMSYIGHPIVGDELYDGSTEQITRQALHAYRIEFIHPFTQERIEAEAEMPEDMQRLIKNQEVL
ncbi:MAG: RluA family pseudouridine synthase [Clostridiales bacterium]|nr:RluA family pseudouridine synthase [Clostridiales bacterium]